MSAACLGAAWGLLAACGEDATREEAAARTCDCIVPGLTGADREMCISNLADRLERNMCPQSCLDCFACAESCGELDEGCEGVGAECLECL